MPIGARRAPVDVLGNGFVVVPPSRGPKGEYRFIQGTLDDIERLPIIQHTAVDNETAPCGSPEGQRNNQLFRHCMRSAARASSLDEVLDAGRSFNADCQPQLEETEVINTAQSAWNYTVQGTNRFGQHGAWLAAEEILRMLATANHDALILLAFLRAHNGPWAKFMCTNTLADVWLGSSPFRRRPRPLARAGLRPLCSERRPRARRPLQMGLRAGMQLGPKGWRNMYTYP